MHNATFCQKTRFTSALKGTTEAGFCYSENFLAKERRGCGNETNHWPLAWRSAVEYPRDCVQIFKRSAVTFDRRGPF